MKPVLKMEVSNEGVIEFLNGILGRTNEFARHLDNQTNILIGLSSVIFTVAITGLSNGNKNPALFILALSSGISAIASLLAIHPPKAMRKRGQEESLMYSKKISTHASSLDYLKQLENVIKSREEIVKQYAVEIYNLDRFYYRPKRKLFKVARNILLFGLIFSLIFFIVSL